MILHKPTTVKYAQVSIVIASHKDWANVEEAAKLFKEHGIPFEVAIEAPYRDPRSAIEYAEQLEERMLAVVIAASGGANSLAPFIAGITRLPVIALPLGQTDEQNVIADLAAVLSSLEPASGTPVMTVGLNEVRSAAAAAVAILGVKDPRAREIVDKIRSQKQAEREEGGRQIAGALNLLSGN